jgi:ATP-dependent Zn protease
MWLAWHDIAQLSYTDLIRAVEHGKVASVTITETMIEGQFKEPQDGRRLFISARVDPNAAAAFDKAGVKVSGDTNSNWLSTILSWVLPVLVFFGLWMFLFRGFAERQGMGGLINIGKSKARVYVERKTGVTFEDVAGVDEAKPELKEIVAFLQDKDKHGRLGMSDKVGQAVLEEERQQWLGDGSRLHPKDYSEATAREVVLVIGGMIDDAYASAKDLLRSRLDDLKAGACLLLSRETITPNGPFYGGRERRPFPRFLPRQIKRQSGRSMRDDHHVAI